MHRATETVQLPTAQGRQAGPWTPKAAGRGGPGRPRKAGRIRRSSADLEATSAKVLAYVRSNAGQVLATLWLAGACGSASPSSGPLEAAENLPEPAGWVSDLAELLSPSEQLELELLLKDFEARTGNEFAVLTVPSTGSEKIEEFSLRVAQDWGIGKQKLDNGLLIVVAREDRCARIEVSRGLSQGPISDSVAQEVMERDMVPAFAEGRWADGLHAGVQALMATVEQR